MMLTQLADVARRTGYPVIELPGWKSRGHGPMVNVLGVTCHHTANGGVRGDAPSVRVVRDGRPGLAGPLAHFVLAKSGTIIVVAAGLCWHAGVSRHPDETNSHRIGIEAEADGRPGAAGDWPPAQMDSYARLCAALAHEFHFPVSEVLGHKETCAPPGRKTDPSFDMGHFRVQVADRYEEADMPLTDHDVERIAQAVLDAKVKLTKAAAAAIGGDTKEGDEVSLRYLVQWSPLTRRVAREDAARDEADAKRDAQLKRLVDDLAVSVGQIGRTVGVSGGVDLDELAEAVADKLAARLAT